jgi:hypothetical protein
MGDHTSEQRIYKCYQHPSQTPASCRGKTKFISYFVSLGRPQLSLYRTPSSSKLHIPFAYFTLCTLKFTASSRIPPKPKSIKLFPESSSRLSQYSVNTYNFSIKLTISPSFGEARFFYISTTLFT